MEAQICFTDEFGFFLFVLAFGTAWAILINKGVRLLLELIPELERAWARPFVLLILVALFLYGLRTGTAIPLEHEVILRPDEELIAKAVGHDRHAKVLTRRGGQLHVRDLRVPTDKELIIKRIVPSDLKIIE